MEPFVLALAILGLADSISFMIVMPSLSFYVASLNGSQDFYGTILALYSFMSFLGKPLLGRWSDMSNFQTPYMVSITLSVIGGLLYSIAPVFANSTSGLTVLALSRILGGLGRSNSALGFAYIARACPANERTSTTAMLGGIQMIGMAIAPVISAFVAQVDFDLFGMIHFNYLNTVGLIMVAINLASQFAIYFYLPDLSDVSEGDKDEDIINQDNESQWMKILRCILRNPHIGVPFLTIFVFNFNFQFIEVSLAPSAFDALNWSTVEVSYTLGAMAIFVFIGMTSVQKLSKLGTSDHNLLIWGLIGNTLGYAALYLLWFRGVNYIAFITPVFVTALSFAFLGAPNRSLFSEAVDNESDLAGYEGTMQALLSMASSVGGFTAPWVITHYCLRQPSEVETSSNGFEFNPLALMSPSMSLAVMLLSYVAGEPGGNYGKEVEIENIDEEMQNEKTSLLNIERRPSKRSKECGKSIRESLTSARSQSLRCSILGITFDDDELDDS